MISSYPLEEESVRTALDAMRQAEAIQIDHPLVYSLWMRLRQDGTPNVNTSGHTATDALIFERLAHLIHHSLNKHRALYGLLPVLYNTDRATVETNLSEDFRYDNSELKGWSYLYYRYVRVDLALSVEELETLTQEDRRTLQRRLSRAIRRLTHLLIRRENATRTRFQQAAQRSKLPFPVAPQLIGRDGLVRETFRRLSEGSQPHHVLLIGAPRIGKSALALTVTHLMIDRLPLDAVAWIDQPDPELDKLLYDIYIELGLLFATNESPATFLQQQDALIVIDHAQALLNNTTACAAILRQLGTARLILCATQPNPQLDIPRLRLAPLDQSAAITLLVRLSQDFQLHNPEDIEHFGKLYDELGGNPGALRQALEMGRRYRAPLVSRPVYRVLWDQLSESARLIWLVLVLSPEARLPEDRLFQLLPDLDTDSINEALSELTRLSVLDDAVDGVPGEIGLGALARSFAESLMRDGSESTLVNNATQMIADYLAVNPDLTSVVHLLNYAQEADLSARSQIDLAYTFSNVLTRGGVWSIWVRILEPLRATAQGQDRWWIGLRLGIAWRWLARWDTAAYALAEVIEQAGAAGAFDWQADAMIELATVQRYQRHDESAWQLLQRAHRFYSRAKNVERRAERLEAITAERVLLALTLNDLAAAQGYLSEFDGSNASARLLNLEARFAFQSGDLEKALNFAQRTQRERIGDLPRLARASALLGQIHARLGNRRAAIDHLLGAMTMMEPMGDRAGYARAQMNLAAVYLGQGNLRTALYYLRDLPPILERLGDEESLQAVLENLEMLNRVSRRWKARSK
ncbi:MAG: tetratricopeptide repeat protein [Chloroflexota bacterium]